MDDAPKIDPTSGLIATIPHVVIEAFHITQEFAATMQQVSADRRMYRANVAIHSGGVEAAIRHYEENSSPEVIIVEVSGSASEILQQIDSLAQVCVAGTKVIVVGKTNDIFLYRELVQRNVSEYLIAPVGIIPLIRTIANAFYGPDATPIGRTIAVFSSNGGVGASTVAHNLAWAISKQHGIATVLVDFDVAFGTAGLDFAQDPPVTISDALIAEDKLDATVVEGLLIKCRNNENLSLITAPATLDFHSTISEQLIENFSSILRSNTAPIVIFDIPHIWTSWTRRLLLSADEVIVVSTPTLANLRNAKNLFDTFRGQRPHDSAPKLLLNQVGMPKRPEIPHRDFVKAVNAEMLDAIPFNVELFYDAANKGQMLAEAQPSDKTTEKFQDIASLIVGRPIGKKKKNQILEKIFGKFKRKK